jgi:hypothetical protein
MLYQQPPYAAGFTPQTYNPSRPLVLLNNETVGAGGKSVQFGMTRDRNLGTALSVVVAFAGDPGTTTVALQTADVDDEPQYVTKTSLDNSVLNTNFVGRIEATDVVAKFGRVYIPALANNVAVTVTVF